MKIWISKNSEVPVREQLVTQITLGIASGDLNIGEKLPSTREIARRCDLHSNTVSSAYQKLVDSRLIEFRQGSGYYVAESAGDRIEGERRLELLIENFLRAAGELGFDREEVVSILAKPRETAPGEEIVVVESDDGLRDILVHELSKRFPQTTSITLEDFIRSGVAAESTIAAMFDEKPKIEPHLISGQRCVFLKGRSVSAAMAGQERPDPDATVAVVSAWDGFLTFARIMLLAARVDPGRLIVRSTADDGWHDAIAGAAIIICDSLTAQSLDGLAPNARIRKFEIVSDESILELASP